MQKDAASYFYDKLKNDYSLSHEEKELLMESMSDYVHSQYDAEHFSNMSLLLSMFCGSFSYALLLLINHQPYASNIFQLIIFIIASLLCGGIWFLCVHLLFDRHGFISEHKFFRKFIFILPALLFSFYFSIYFKLFLNTFS